MGQKLIIAPNECLLSLIGLATENAEKGALALNVDWSEELIDSAISDTLINSVVKAEAPHISIAVSQQSDEAAHGIKALLMSPQDYIVASFANALPKQAEVIEALKNWDNYFKALQQHQYILDEHFAIELLPTSSLPKELQALSNTVRCALQSETETNELLQQFEAFSASDKTQSWVDVVCFGLMQYNNIESTKNECAKANEALNTAKSEQEAVKKELAQKSESLTLLTQQLEKEQKEKEAAVREVTNTKNTAAELEAKYKGASSELASAKDQASTLAAEHSELKSESELLLLQTQQLQEELESVFAEVNHAKAAVADSNTKYEKASSQLAEVNAEKERIAKQNTEQAKENELLLLQIQQLQEELEAVFSKLSNVEADFERVEQNYKQLKENAKAEEIASTHDKVVAEKVTGLEEEKALLLLQINQLQEELESTFAQSEDAKKAKDSLIQNLETKLAQAEKHSPKLQRELENAMSEQELLQLQIKQLQEELEFYFTEYQKLKGESPDNKALAEFKSKVEERFPHLVLSEGVTLTGGANQKDLQRITARFTQVEHGDKHWNAFSIIVNDRKGLLDIELHAPDKKRIYPLSKFVKTGSNKVCDFSLLSPFTDAGKKALAELPTEDHLLLIGIIEELQTKLQQGNVQRTDATANLDVALWPEKLQKLATALKQLTPKQASKPLSFKKLSLKQNMVGTTNEHLLICVENLQANGISFPAFDIKVGAKQIKDKAFTEYGSLEFRELANNQAPLATWPPETKDKWGLKLVLDLPAQLNEEQQNAINSLKEEDQKFVKALLTKLADRLHTLDRKKLKVNQPLENWQKLIAVMAEKF